MIGQVQGSAHGRRPPSPGVAKGSEQVVETTLKPDFSVVLTPMVGEDLDKELRAKKVHRHGQCGPPTAPACC